VLPLPSTLASMAKLKAEKAEDGQIKPKKGDPLKKTKKAGRPLNKAEEKLDKLAKKALKSGELDAQAADRRRQRDARTLYVRFKKAEAMPESVKEIKDITEGIKHVRKQ